MKLKFIVAIAAGLLVGSVGTYFVMSGEKASASMEQSFETDTEGIADDPFGNASEIGELASSDSPNWTSLLSKFSGTWTSADGQQNAKLDDRTLQFDRTGAWADLENHNYLLGQELQFLSEDGFYTVCLVEEHDVIRIIKEDLVTADVYGFTLHREGSVRARARPPLKPVETPQRISELLVRIPSISPTDSKETVLKAMNLDVKKMEVLDLSGSLGETDVLLNLGTDNHWMLKLGYRLPRPDSKPQEAILKRFQIVRGYVEDVREGHFDVEEFIYPYFVNDKVVAGSRKVEQSGKE
jgi:hypothetical protein